MVEEKKQKKQKQAQESSPEQNEKQLLNPYCEVLAKRLRTLRKRLTKIEKYESSDWSTLNQDQISAVEKKPEVVSAIKELEDAFKQMNIIDVEEAKKTKALLESVEQEWAQKLKQQVEETKKQAEDRIKTVFETLYIGNVLLPNLPPISSTLVSEEQFNAVLLLKSLLNGQSTENIEGVEAFVNVAQDVLRKLSSLEYLETEFVEGVTFSQLKSTLDLILSPPPPPKFGSDPEEVVPEVVPEPAISISESALPATGLPLRNSSFGISFINPSEVLIDEPAKPAVETVEPVAETVPEVPVEQPVVTEQIAPAVEPEKSENAVVGEKKPFRNNRRGGGFRGGYYRKRNYGENGKFDEKKTYDKPEEKRNFDEKRSFGESGKSEERQFHRQYRNDRSDRPRREFQDGPRKHFNNGPRYHKKTDGQEQKPQEKTTA